MAAVQQLSSINSLRRGQVAEVRHVVGPVEHVHRLEELGLRAGARVELVRGGATCIVRINGGTFCFRSDETVSVLVAPRVSA